MKYRRETEAIIAAYHSIIVNKMRLNYNDIMNGPLIHEYLERLSNLLRTEARRSGTAYGLQPVQLQALHYLAICNRYSEMTVRGTVNPA